MQSLAIPLLKRKSYYFPITLVTEIYCNALAQVIENHQFDYLEHITLVTNQDPGALKLLKSYLNQRTLQVAQDEELNVDDEELYELLDFELDQLDCSFEPDSGLTDKCYLSEMEQKAPAELDLKDSSIPKKQMTINLLPIREARLRTTRSSELFSIASIGLFSIASILKKSYLWDKASSKTKKSKVKRNSVVATKLPSEVVTGPEKIETKLDDLKIDFDLEPKIEKSLLEEVKAQLHTANLKVTNLREQLRITRDELDKFYALKNIPGEEYRSAPLPVALAHNMVESEISSHA